MPVNVSGIKEMKKALGLVDKDLLKEVQGEIRAAMIPIRDKARGYAPADSAVLSGWTKSAGLIGPMRYRTFPKYNQQQVIEGIKYSAGANKRNSKGWSANNYVSNNSAPGAIYETAGRKNPNGAPWIGLQADVNNKEISHSPYVGEDWAKELAPVLDKLAQKKKAILIIAEQFSEEAKRGQNLEGQAMARISHNYEKFLVSRDGIMISRFNWQDMPLDETPRIQGAGWTIRQAIDEVLG